MTTTECESRSDEAAAIPGSGELLAWRRLGRGRLCHPSRWRPSSSAIAADDRTRCIAPTNCLDHSTDSRSWRKHELDSASARLGESARSEAYPEPVMRQLPKCRPGKLAQRLVGVLASNLRPGQQLTELPFRGVLEHAHEDGQRDRQAVEVAPHDLARGHKL
jgi:hypothetical protein